MPSDVPTLTEFAFYCQSHYSGSGGMFEDPVQKAWRGKASAAFARLRLAAIDDPKLSAFLTEHVQANGTPAPPNAGSGLSSAVGGIGTATGKVAGAIGDALTDSIKTRSDPNNSIFSGVFGKILKGFIYFVLISFAFNIIGLILIKLLFK